MVYPGLAAAGLFNGNEGDRYGQGKEVREADEKEEEGQKEGEVILRPD